MHVVATKQYASVTEGIGTCAQMSFMPFASGGGEWFLNRCIVHKDQRRQGFGSKMLDILKQHADEYAIVVTPGGYGYPLEDQIAFYESCGFEKCDDGAWRFLNAKQI